MDRNRKLGLLFMLAMFQGALLGQRSIAADVQTSHPLDRGSRANTLQQVSPSDPSTAGAGVWQDLGGGLNGVVYALARSANGIVAGGNFSGTNAATFNRVARWDGQAWQNLGTGLTGYIPVCYALAVDSPYVYAGGKFSAAGGSWASNIARWDGTNWQPLGAGVTGGGEVVAALAVANGYLYAGGSFTSAGGVPAHNIARWNGSTWEPLAGGLNNTVRAIWVMGGILYAGGVFDSAGTQAVSHVARWDGSQWHAMGTGLDGDVFTLAEYNGDLIAGGVFTNGIVRWDGTSWSAVGSGVDGAVYAMAKGGSGLFVGGIFTSAGGQPANLAAEWDGTQWSTLAGGVNSVVFACAADHPSIYYGGAFTIAGSVAASNVARWIDMGTTTLALISGWNLVSLPRIPLSALVFSLFPGRSSDAFAYDPVSQNYSTVTTLTVGSGYWLNYAHSTAVPIQGTIIDSLDIAEPNAGWNLIGSTTLSVPVASISTTPPGAIAPGTVYRYDAVSQSYEPAIQIEPGEACWVLLSQPCTVRLRRP